MHFVKLTMDGRDTPTFVNMDLVCEIFPLPVSDTRAKEGSMVFFQCVAGDDQAYSKVTESPDEILALC